MSKAKNPLKIVRIVFAVAYLLIVVAAVFVTHQRACNLDNSLKSASMPCWLPPSPEQLNYSAKVDLKVNDVIKAKHLVFPENAPPTWQRLFRPKSSLEGKFVARAISMGHTIFEDAITPTPQLDASDPDGWSVSIVTPTVIAEYLQQGDIIATACADYSQTCQGMQVAAARCAAVDDQETIECLAWFHGESGNQCNSCGNRVIVGIGNIAFPEDLDVEPEPETEEETE